MRRLWLWSRDTRRHSTWPCLRGSSDRLSVSVQMDCELRDGLEILSEELSDSQGAWPGIGLQWPPCPACGFLLHRSSKVKDKLSIPFHPQLWKTRVWYPRGRDLLWTKKSRPEVSTAPFLT